ncbi:hypothetical protein BKA80DRAFT_276781 [Phyllosticta citrichinensis]
MLFWHGACMYLDTRSGAPPRPALTCQHPHPVLDAVSRQRPPSPSSHACGRSRTWRRGDRLHAEKQHNAPTPAPSPWVSLSAHPSLALTHAQVSS